MICCDLFVRLQRRQFLTWLCLDSLATAIALILDVTCTVRHVTHHWALSLSHLWARASPFVILIHRVELVELVSETHSPQRFWFILSRVIYYADVASRGTYLSLEIGEYIFIVRLHATLDIVLVDILNALQLILLVIGTSGPCIITAIFLVLIVVSVIIIVSRSATFSCIGIEEMEKLGKGVIGYLFKCVT